LSDQGPKDDQIVTFVPRALVSGTVVTAELVADADHHGRVAARAFKVRRWNGNHRPFGSIENFAVRSRKNRPGDAVNHSPGNCSRDASKLSWALRLVQREFAAAP
jgi:hypothetical protein